MVAAVRAVHAAEFNKDPHPTAQTSSEESRIKHIGSVRSQPNPVQVSCNVKVCSHVLHTWQCKAHFLGYVVSPLLESWQVICLRIGLHLWACSKACLLGCASFIYLKSRSIFHFSLKSSEFDFIFFYFLFFLMQSMGQSSSHIQSRRSYYLLASGLSLSFLLSIFIMMLLLVCGHGFVFGISFPT